MAGTMVAFNSRGDHFIPPPVSQAAVLEALRRAVGTVSKSGSLPYLGRWGLAPPDFSSLLSLHHCKEEVGKFLKRGQSPLFPSYWPFQATNEVCLGLVRQADAKRLVCGGPGARSPLLGWVGGKCVDQGRGLSLFFDKLSFGELKRKLPESRVESLVDKGSGSAK